MDIEYLKKTWEKLPSESSFDEKQLKKMLSRRTKNLIDRIDRNIKIGFAILFVLIVIFIIDDFVLSPILLESATTNIVVPAWLQFLGVFSNMLIFTTFIYFAIKYYRVKRSCETVCDLKNTLVKIISTLQIYKTMFYLALAALLVAAGTGLVSGMFTAFVDNAAEHGLGFSQVKTQEFVVAIIIGLVMLFVLVGGIFVFLRWGFQRLYGNYIDKLKNTLSELEEISD